MSDLFIIDAGNTNIVLGVYRDGKSLYQERIETVRDGLKEDYERQFLSFLEKNSLKATGMEGVAISNVVPALGSLLDELALDLFGYKPFYVSYKNRMNMTVKMDNPGELGADLIASSVAAIEKYGAPCIVIDFGTATTYAAINGNAEFLGGAISQGINVSCKGLYMHAPHLPKIELKSPPSIVGKNTVTAMQSGIYLGYAHMVRGIITDMKKVVGEKAKVIATGGLAVILKDEENLMDVIDQDLVPDGIYYLYQLNK